MKPWVLSRPPAADSELSFVADGLRSAVVRWCKEAEQAVRLIAYTGGEVQPGNWARCMVVSKTQGPQAGVFARISLGLAAEAIEAPASSAATTHFTSPPLAH